MEHSWLLGVRLKRGFSFSRLPAAAPSPPAGLVACSMFLWWIEKAIQKLTHQHTEEKRWWTRECVEHSYIRRTVSFGITTDHNALLSEQLAADNQQPKLDKSAGLLCSFSLLVKMRIVFHF